MVAILLMGCADDTTRLAGGTGSDLPRPTARLLDTSLNLIDAKVWRLWQVYGDSAKASSQVVDSSGFVVPSSGQWIVEAWKDSSASGVFEPARRVQIGGKLDKCETNLTYIHGMAEEFVGVLPCRDIAAPSGSARPPMGWGVFGRSDTIHRIVKIEPPAAVDAWRFLVWKVRTDSTRRSVPGIDGGPTKNSTILVINPVARYSPYRGLVDITVSPGIWLFQGWNGNILDSLQRKKWRDTIPDTMWVDSTVLSSCIEKRWNCAQVGDGAPAVSFSVTVK
ncbi:MAG: hypothetical protein AAB214_11330 [Fibrobacterota bacterium]